MIKCRKIKNYNYTITIYGTVRALRTNKIIKPYISNGYYKVDLYENSERRKVYIHQLVGETFHSDTYFGGAIINHKDGNRLNNFYKNVEWVTYSYNIQHSYDILGRICIKPKGHRSWNAKCILQFDLNDNFIKEYGSVVDAQNEYGGTIERALSGRNKTSYGFKWKYKEEV